jgi:hypothetical protein
MTTVVIQIGNSDNKLTQSEWADFVGTVHDAVMCLAGEIHFSGGSTWSAPWQNACWVCLANQDGIHSLKEAMRIACGRYRQD